LVGQTGGNLNSIGCFGDLDQCAVEIGEDGEQWRCADLSCRFGHGYPLVEEVVSDATRVGGKSSPLMTVMRQEGLYERNINEAFEGGSNRQD
jgi:hypothetical protein